MKSKRDIEIWKPIPGYKNRYEVSNIGNIRRVYADGSTKMLKKSECDGYFILRLAGKSVRVHRIVAMVFIPNPNNLPCINHKDFNRKNNKVENLEWCTQQYNAIYSAENFSKLKNVTPGRSGEKHIVLCNGKYRLQIRLKRLKYNRTFETLEEAKAKRDCLLKEYAYA